MLVVTSQNARVLYPVSGQLPRALWLLSRSSHVFGAYSVSGPGRLCEGGKWISLEGTLDTGGTRMSQPLKYYLDFALKNVGVNALKGHISFEGASRKAGQHC